MSDQVPDVVKFVPIGSNILIELINVEEIIPKSTLDLLGGNTKSVSDDYGAPQAYVLAVGPSVKPEDWGFKVGDRVALSASMTPLPHIAVDGDEDLDARGRPKRRRGTLDSPAGIKAVLVEK